MKKFLILYLLLAGSVFAAAAPAAGVVWEITGTGGAGAGSTNNGGFFNPGNVSFVSNFTCADGTLAAPILATASYNFASGDVGAWVYIKAGTHWNTGYYYKITGVTSNNAILDAATGHGYAMINGKATASAGPGISDGAGSLTSGTCGIDYSRLGTTPILTRSDLASNTVTPLQVTSAGNLFTPVMVGNALHITQAGTGSFGLTGWYEVATYVDAGTITTDVTTNNGTAMASGVGQIGGSLAALGNIGSATAGQGAVAGNVVWLNGTFSVASDTVACVGTATNPLQFIGYGTFRGDGNLGRTATTGKNLITTNLPTYVYTAGSSLTYTNCVFSIWQNIYFSVATGTSGAIVTAAADSVMTGCKILNPSTNTAAGGWTSGGARSTLTNCDIFLSGSGGGGVTGYAVRSSTTSRIFGNFVQMTSTGGVALDISAGAFVEDNTIIGNGGTVGVYLSNASVTAVIRHNTIVGFADGVKGITGITGMQHISQNMLTENTSNAINFVDPGAAAYVAYNRMRDSATVTNATNWVACTSFGVVVTDTGNYSTDYIDYTTQDLRLKVTSPVSPGLNVAAPASASMGARQAPVTSAAQVGHSY